MAAGVELVAILRKAAILRRSALALDGNFTYAASSKGSLDLGTGRYGVGAGRVVVVGTGRVVVAAVVVVWVPGFDGAIVRAKTAAVGRREVVGAAVRRWGAAF